MKSLLVLCFTDLKNDARVTRQVNFLKETYRVTAAVFDAYPDPGRELFVIKKTNLTFLRKAVASVFLLLGINRIAYALLHNYQSYVPTLRDRKFDIIVANDIEALPLAFSIAGQHSKVFFDAHEYAPRHFEDRLYWRIFFQRFNTALCRHYIPRVAGMSTINNGLASEYEKHFGVKPIIVTNASPFIDLHANASVANPIRLVHHGIFNMSRRPELMIDMMEALDNRFTLDLIYLLPGSASPQTKEYFETYKAKAAATGKINILPALKGSEIVPSLHATYDLGIILIPPVNFNYENGLPNKLFDCIQARIGMVAGPLREIAQIVKHYDIGVVSEDFTGQGMANALKALTTNDIARFKANTDVAARELSAEHNQKIFLEALARIA
ncbi:hypothetical protein [Chryseolinea lacunae]|uniref:Glycosyltransferase n=1 Tax=Chryseolinea lacunae TaxID=2801331 RepID=A0ABS1KPV8_9BACT|nr:hypothetical protein [Chryseolinea lacunae]MBL0741350.1 hypothetical protein [Chryseolinea lacunae]